jgi:AbrB family looped-hinge helix DNA binding protein
MERQITTVSTKGQLVIPAEMRTRLGIHPGTRVSMTIEDQRIILQPVSEKLVDETLGMLAGGPSLADELQKERRTDKW